MCANNRVMVTLGPPKKPGTRPNRQRKWYAGKDSNPRPSDPKSDALSTELPAHEVEPIIVEVCVSRSSRPHPSVTPTTASPEPSREDHPPPHSIRRGEPCRSSSEKSSSTRRAPASGKCSRTSDLSPNGTPSSATPWRPPIAPGLPPSVTAATASCPTAWAQSARPSPPGTTSAAIPSRLKAPG
jgi:hypothetical protein